jgi:serine/threonine protein kinase
MQFSIIIQILDSLAKIHSKNVIHCDINTYNFLIDFGNVKLFNFSAPHKPKK